MDMDTVLIDEGMGRGRGLKVEKVGMNWPEYEKWGMPGTNA